MMMYSGTFHPSLEIAEELLVADQPVCALL